MAEVGLVGEIVREKRPLGRAHDVYFLFNLRAKPRGGIPHNEIFIKLNEQQLQELRRFREIVPKESIIGSAGLKVDTQKKRVTWRLLFPFAPSANIPFDYKTMDAIRNARPYRHGIGALGSTLEQNMQRRDIPVTLKATSTCGQQVELFSIDLEYHTGKAIQLKNTALL